MLHGKGESMERIELIGNSAPIQKVRQLIEQVASTQANVMILGGSGTGKELAARIIHQHSPRASGPFVALNCAAIPLDLLESELFGHEKGAFTGAHQTRLGRFELAAGGTLFLDEIGDMPVAMQAKLLRVLQDHQFERVGGNKRLSADVRVISATHKNLVSCIQKGAFREDLYYRLNVFPIELPLLRHRKQDIPLLIHYFIEHYQTQTGQPKIVLTEAAVDCLVHYEWPGNVRELANLIERFTILFSGKRIEDSDLSDHFFKGESFEFAGQEQKRENKREDKDFTLFTARREFDKSLPPLGFDLREHLAQLEYDYIQQALNEYHGIVSRAAKRLGLRRTTLVEKMRKYGIDRKLTG